MECSYCGGTRFSKNGTRATKKGRVQRYICSACGAAPKSTKEAKLRINDQK